jgi:hypothetical protein
VALGLAAGRNEDELSVPEALLSAIDDPKLWRVQFVVRKNDSENLRLGFFRDPELGRSRHLLQGDAQGHWRRFGCAGKLGDAFEQGICLLNAGKLFLN